MCNNEIILIVPSIILVIITAYYAWTNHRYLKEFCKDRKVKSIEMKLEKFYSPYVHNRYLIDKFPWIEPNDRNWDWALRTLTDIRSHAYLAMSSTQSDLAEYLSKVDINRIEESEEGENFKKLREKMNTTIGMDYKYLLRELEKLTK